MKYNKIILDDTGDVLALESGGYNAILSIIYPNSEPIYVEFTRDRLEEFKKTLKELGNVLEGDD